MRLPSALAHQRSREVAKYDGAFTRVRLVRAWIITFGELVLLLYGFSKLLDQIL
jgi:hypothetical protein